jgi:hypothetical protein
MTRPTPQVHTLRTHSKAHAIAHLVHVADQCVCHVCYIQCLYTNPSCKYDTHTARVVFASMYASNRQTSRINTHVTYIYGTRSRTITRTLTDDHTKHVAFVASSASTTQVLTGTHKPKRAQTHSYSALIAPPSAYIARTHSNARTWYIHVIVQYLHTNSNCSASVYRRIYAYNTRTSNHPHTPTHTHTRSVPTKRILHTSHLRTQTR